MGLFGAQEAKLNAHAPTPSPAHPGGQLTHVVRARQSDRDDDLGAEGRSDCGLDEHPANAHVARDSVERFGLPLDHEGEGDVELGAVMATLFDHGTDNGTIDHVPSERRKPSSRNDSKTGGERPTPGDRESESGPISDRSPRGTGSPRRIRDRIPLPASVSDALSKAAETSAKKPSSAGSRALALVPLLVTLLLIGVLFPRAVAPHDVPLPTIDTRAIEAANAMDRQWADTARQGLSDDTRILGSALRAFNRLQTATSPASEGEILNTRANLNHATAKVLQTSPNELKLLRAIQLEVFQREIAEYERTGVEPTELQEVGGQFLKRMKDVGWATDRKVLPDTTVRAVLFKLTWNGTLSLVNDTTLEPSLDEMRALYAFYIEHPHVAETRRGALQEARRTAKTKAECEEIANVETQALEDWRLEKVKRLGAIDPTYPTTFALGVVHYRLGRYGASAEAFRDWIRDHPDGSLALRAQNHLRAAVAADARL